ncbi:porin [Stieleria mannarensis]|uniref:porin n=1 Tax=Stieleria mannarensis TaxID=2755585 RepID=UPI0016044B39|nr:porin [Rhodopirellula sp. JC639]
MKLLSIAAGRAGLWAGLLIASAGLVCGQGTVNPIPLDTPTNPPRRAPVDDGAAACSAGECSAEESLAAALRRIEQLERRVVEVEGEIAPLFIEADRLNEVGRLDDPGPACGSDLCVTAAPLASHYVIYDRGWTLRPCSRQRIPFELKLELHHQFRFTQFGARGEPDPDAAGNPRDISDRNDFDINRGRVVFSGYAFSPDLGYYLNIDYSTVASSSILPLLGWTSFRISDRLSLYMGLGKVPGTWEWQQTSRYTLGVDRTMATTFFRPSISAGIWANGSLNDSLHYTVFAGDGFNTLSLRADALDTNLAYSMLAWWEPLGDFGVGFSDLEHHDSFVLRLGHGLTQTQNESVIGEVPNQEGTVFRLTDGTRLTEEGALRPGERVDEFDVWLYTVHAGLKRRGASMSGEYYCRWLRNLRGASGSEFQSLFDHGFYVQSGAFIVPKSVEVFARGSYVTGKQGSGDEVSAGFNWYLFGQRNARATFELADLNDSPAQQSRTGYVAGGSGLLFRAQLWTFY